MFILRCVRPKRYKFSAYQLVNNLAYSLFNSTANPDFSQDELKNKIIYNCVLAQEDIRYLSGTQRKKHVANIKKDFFIKGGACDINEDAICLKYFQDEVATEQLPTDEDFNTVVQFPFGHKDKTIITEPLHNKSEVDATINDTSWLKSSELLLKEMVKKKNWLPHSPDMINDAVVIEEDKTRVQYGSVDPQIPVSAVECGGCGALLHCQDTSIPGFLPKEIFHGLNERELKTLVCQRCHFLKEYDIALGVNVSPDDYPLILSPIKDKKALVVLMVDLLDVPCSIWPGLIDIIGSKRPIVVVANKVDLLVQDGPDFLRTIMESLYDCLVSAGLPKTNIKHVALISAKSGYGVEKLITKIQHSWRNQGDIFIVGCTNVGKSTLFNSLIQSDMCKVQAVDLMQRATVSQWPGTTLNLLRFPILKPSDWRLFVRKSRLVDREKEEMMAASERTQRLKKSLYRMQSPLAGDVGRSFLPESPLDSSDPFSLAISSNPRGVSPLGLNPNDKAFKESKWCYDTPGVVHPDQILNLLTTTEIMDTLPQKLIIPRVLHLRPGHAVFIAGLARLDLLQGPEFVWLSVFASNALPLTITRIEDANQVYHQLLGSDLLKVPRGGEDRLSKWPRLKDRTVEITGKIRDEVAADLVLSSAGWVGVTMDPAEFCTIRAWTPDARGIRLRQPLLKKAHKLKGNRIYKTPVFRTNLHVTQSSS